MKFDLTGKVAVVTGGTRGIGRAIAEAFIEAGGTVVLSGRSEDKGKQALAEIGAGDRAHFVAGDASNKADVERLIDETVDLYGKVDILVNNAGGNPGHGLVEVMTDEVWLETFDLNLHSDFYATRRALKYMAPAKHGRVIHISSVESKQANKAAVSNYIVTKAAMNAFSKAVAFEYGPLGITSNSICPGAIETDIMKESGPKAAETMGLTYEQFLQSYADDTMIKRLNTVEEVAGLALLLASEHGGGITGATMSVDGGASSY
jgi:3-hydroxybutyrate dehydrogenase